MCKACKKRKEPTQRKVYVRKSNKLTDEERKKIEREKKVEERLAIGRFYRMKPPGHEVDHIILVSKGGKHELKNLQYLTIEENRRKHDKLPKSEVPPLTTVFRGM